MMAAVAAMPLAAAVITPELALERADRATTRAAEAPQLIETIRDAAGQPAIYVYTYSGDKGFMLLSADDATAPLLGYSRENSFSLSGAPASIASFIDGYKSQISEARELGAVKWKTPATRADEMAKIEPLVKTRWDQGTPFNNLCPIVEGQRSVTGCVATAMAQVMNYWKYPLQGQGSITYRPEKLERDLTMDFSEVTFDWENMADIYKTGSYSNPQANAVAWLMRACGYSVKMNYTGWESGAYSYNIANAMQTYFGYDKGISRKERSNYSTKSWKELIYEQLQNCGPVIYTGVSSGGGHCFVCDGYDGEGLFHINWGWGGMSDGYFLLEELTPSAVGTGGHYGGYNIDQDAVIGVTPPVGRLTVNELYVENAAGDSGNVRGWGYTYRINDFYNIRLVANVTVTGGHVSSPIYVMVYETDPTTLKNVTQVLDTTFDEPINDSDGTSDHTTVLNLGGCDVSKLYTVNVAYELMGKKVTIDNLRLAASSAVDGVVADGAMTLTKEGTKLTTAGQEATIEVYNPAGMLVAKGNGEVETAGLQPGVYIARAADVAGRSATLKLHLK